MKKFLLLLVEVLTAVAVQAVPAHPKPVKMQQPDGTYVTICLHGDEWLNFTTTEDGYTVVKDSRAYYVYAELKGQQLKPTAQVAHDAKQRSATEQAFLAGVKKYQAPAIKSEKAAEKEQVQHIQRRALASRRATDYANFHGLVILVQFNDKTFSRTDYSQLANNMLNQANFTSFGNEIYTGSVRDYFSDCSGGLFQPQFDVVGPVTVDYSCLYPNETTNCKEIIKTVLDAVDDEVDFSQYDGDGDGVVDLVYLLVAGNGSNYSGNDSGLWWPHRSTVMGDPVPDNPGYYYYLNKDGVRIYDYASSVELYGWTSQPEGVCLDGIGTICHEFGHVLGLPDFYDTDYSGSGGQSLDPGDWSVMAGGSYNNKGRTPAGYSLYERKLVGFVDEIPTINEKKSYTLEPLHVNQQGYRIDSPVEDEFFLLENRQNDGSYKWDEYLPGHGMMAYRVDRTDLSVWNNNKVNANPAHNYYEILWAGGTDHAHSEYDTFPGEGNVTELNNQTSPANLLTHDGSEIAWRLSNIQEVDGNIVFKVTPANASLNMLEMTNLTLIDGDLDHGLIDGTILRGTISLMNHDVVTNKSSITLRLFDVETRQNKYKPIFVHIAPNSIVTYDFSFSDLSNAHHYVLYASYTGSGEDFYQSPQLLCTTAGMGETEPGNEDLVAYEYWFDNNVASRKTVNLSSNDAIIRANIDTHELSVGLHRFNFRLKRSDGMYSSVTTSTFMNMQTESEGRIVYWFDENCEQTGSTPIANTEDEQTVALDLRDMEKFPLGLHQLNMRVATKGSSLSNIYTARVLKMASGEINQIEYWVDEDYKHPSTISGHVASNDDKAYIFVEPFDLQGLSSGLHRVYFRAVSNGRSTSSAVSMASVVVGGGTPAKIEYWFDNDAANSATVPLPPSALQDTVDVALVMSDAEKFPLGMHQLSMRLVSEGREQSPVYTTRILKMASGATDELEYWVDDDFEHAKRVSGSVASSDANSYIFKDPFDLSGIPAGLHTIYYRAASSKGVANSAISKATVVIGGGETSKLEYWFDDDYEHSKKLSTEVTDNKESSVDKTINLSAVSPGVHRMYYRGVNESGVSKTAVSMTPVMVKSMYNVNASQLKVTGYSVSVDGGAEEVHSVINPRYEVEQSYTLDARNLNKGEHTLRVSAWNSIGTRGSESTRFTVNEVQTPTVTLTATEQNGLVKLQFNSVPNDLRYRIVRTDENGVKAKVDSKEGSSYPAIVSFTDNPVAGTYTYYVQTAYTDYNGSRHSLLSNEVSVTIAEPQPEEVTVDEYGYITGTLVCDKDVPTYGTYVQFSDGITARVNGTLFSRTRIPVGTELEITVNGDVTHEYETKTVTIVKGENQVTINGTLIDENRANNYANDLAFDSDLGIEIIDGSQYAKFSIKNLSYDKSWTGIVRIKAVEKDKADKKGIDVESASYETTTIKVCDSPIFEIGKNKSKEISVSLKKLKVKKDTEYVLYFESIGKLTDSNGEDVCKAIAANTSYNTSVNPLVMTIGVTGSETQQWDDEARQRFASFIVGVSSLVPGINGNVGDLSAYYQKALSTAKAISGKLDVNVAIQEFFSWMAGKSAWEIINEPSIMSATSFIFDVYSNVKSYGNGTMVQKYWNDVLGASYDYGSAQLVISNLALLAHASIGKDPIEATAAAASTIYSLVYPTTSAGAIPYAAMMYSYTVVGRAMVAKLLEFAAIMRSRYIVTRLKSNKPYSGNDENRQNTAVDFKLVVKTKNMIGSSAIDFRKSSASSQIGSISIMAAHQKGNEPAEFSFSPIFMKDCVMLKSDGKGITNNKFLDDMNELRELYMKIVWSNGRETLIPLNEETSGVEISFKGTDPQGIDHFEDFKPLVYTVTLTTTTGKDHMADEFYLGSNKNRE